MITGLLTVHFGVLIGFNVSGLNFKLVPEFFFILSVLLFTLSYFPRKGQFNLQDSNSIRDSYYLWLDYKIKLHKLGFVMLIIGLVQMTVTVMISNNFPESPLFNNNVNASSTSGINT